MAGHAVNSNYLERCFHETDMVVGLMKTNLGMSSANITESSTLLIANGFPPAEVGEGGTRSSTARDISLHTSTLGNQSLYEIVRAQAIFPNHSDSKHLSNLHSDLSGLGVTGGSVGSYLNEIFPVKYEPRDEEKRTESASAETFLSSNNFSIVNDWSSNLAHAAFEQTNRIIYHSTHGIVPHTTRPAFPTILHPSSVYTVEPMMQHSVLVPKSTQSAPLIKSDFSSNVAQRMHPHFSTAPFPTAEFSPMTEEEIYIAEIALTEPFLMDWCKDVDTYRQFIVGQGLHGY